MNVKVVAFAGLKESLGSEQELTLTEGARVSSLVLHLKQRFPDAVALIDACRAALNDRMIEGDPVLADGMTVYLLPPSSGG